MMPPLWLDYQRPPPGRHRAGVLLLVVGVLTTGALFAFYLTVIDERDSLQEEVAHLERQAARRTMLEQAGGQTGGQPGTASPSAARWESLFASLEQAADESVTLLDLEPTASEIRISGEAKDLDATMAYVERLQIASALADAHLTGYEVVADNPYRPVRFRVAAAWRGAQP